MQFRKGRYLLLFLLVMAGGALSLTTYLWARGIREMASLDHRYPVIHYKGRNRPPEVTLEKSRPPHWRSLDHISRLAIGAVLVSEDWAFYAHKGFDIRQIENVLEESWKKKRFVRGASTITQQVARNLLLTKKKTLWRKIRELTLAILLEKKWGKKKILETYFNIAEWGEGIYGISLASRTYFGKSPSELTAKEGAFLAMLLPNPKLYSSSFRNQQLTPYAEQTIQRILDKMVQARFLTPEEREMESEILLPFEVPFEGAVEEELYPEAWLSQ